VYYLLEELKKR